MFLVKDRRLGMDTYVFTRTDPRTDGYKGDVIEGVSLDYDMNAIHIWPDGEDSPNPQLGRNPKNPKHYKVFKFPQELRTAGFEFVNSNTPFVTYSWSDYRKRYFPVPEEYAKSMSQDEWFDFLEEADFAAKIRKKMGEPVEPKPGSTRDQIAEWVAKRHMGADAAIQQVWFLPAESPTDEIRLLEVSERYTPESGEIEPFDFGVDVADTKVKLRVADVTVEQIAKIKAEPAKWLPKGWKINDALVWGRRK
ncbi:MAG: hypothetical protein ACJ8F7_00280 [Gemmataceae bacterium]